MRPVDEAGMAEAVRAAAGALFIRGGGTRGFGGVGEVLEVGGLSGITLYEPGAMTLVARAGTPLAEVEAALAAEGQRLAFEPLDLRGLLGTVGEPTVGGMVASNASGPRRIQAGACRDALLGVRFVDGTGAVIKNGGRVMKNVTGYDLVKLLAGSFGTLGVLTEVALKVLPVPEACGSVLLRGLSGGQAVVAMALAIGSPFDVTGAAHLPGGETVLRVEGFAGSVVYRCGRLAGILAGFGDVEIEPESAARWRALRDVAAFQGLPGDVWRVSMKPSDAPGIVARMGGVQVVYDWAGGLIWALVAEGTDLRRVVGRFAGHMTLVRASAVTKLRVGVFQPEAPAVAAITAGLRAKFDPRGVFNPGLMATV